MTAQPIRCDLCGDELAAMLVSNLGNGETLGVGSACMFAWASSMAATFDPANQPAENGEAQPETADTDGESGRTSARRPRARSKRPTVVPTGADDTGATETAPDATAD